MAEQQSLDKSSVITTPFFPIDGRDEYRPYFSMMDEHDASAATIILVQRNIMAQPTNNKTVDYFNSFATKVNTLLDDAISSNSNSIPDLKIVANNEPGQFYGIFRNFSLMQYGETRDEIAKVALNFGAQWNAYFFGAKPRVYNFGGFFLDSKNYPYYEQFMRAYDNYLAGSKCIANGFRLYMAYDNKITSGWMLGISVNASADQHFSRPFTFQLLVDDENWFRTNWQYDIGGNVIDTESRVLSNTYQIPGMTK